MATHWNEGINKGFSDIYEILIPKNYLQTARVWDK